MSPLRHWIISNFDPEFDEAEVHFTPIARSFFLGWHGVANAQEEGDFFSLQRRLIELFEENKGAIVRVRARFQKADEEERPQVVLGTGFFISREGHVLTNANATHLTSGQKADRISVEHNGIDYAAEILGSDASTNLSLVKVDTLPENFNFLHLADSSATPVIGSMVIRLSALFEFGPSPRLGLVTGLESRFGNKLFRVPYLRTNMSLGPGEGGSPLLDLSGKLVAVSVANLPPDLQSSYAIPARAALRIRDELLFSQDVTYGWLGFDVQMRTTTLSGAQVVIREIFPDAPAEKSGLLVDDVLLKIGDQQIHDTSDMDNALFYLREGQFVTVKVLRVTEEIDFTVRVAPRSQDQPFLAEARIPEADDGNETPFNEDALEQAAESDAATGEGEDGATTETESDDQ